MEIGLAVGGAFLSSALNVLFDRISPQGDLFKMFQKHKHHVWLLKTLRMTLLGLQAVLSDGQNKPTSNPYMSQWLNEIQDAVDCAENLMEDVNSEALRLKVEGQHQNFAKKATNQQSCENGSNGNWLTLGNGEFPALKILSIEDSPKLIEKFPEDLCSLTGLRISKCHELSWRHLSNFLV